MNELDICSCCGQDYEDISKVYGVTEPDCVAEMTPREKHKRVKLDTDLCIVDKKHFFIRASIHLTVNDSNESFYWGVWSTISKFDLDILQTYWDTPGRENIIEPALGHLATNLPIYPDTTNLRMLIHTLPVGTRPLLQLEATDHPLAIEQREGITMARLHEINMLMNH